MTLLQRLSFEHEFSRFNLKGLSVLQRKMLIDLIRQRHPQLWSRFRSNAYSWATTKERLNRFVNVHRSEFVAELEKDGFNHDGFSETAERKG